MKRPKTRSKLVPRKNPVITSIRPATSSSIQLRTPTSGHSTRPKIPEGGINSLVDVQTADHALAINTAVKPGFFILLARFGLLLTTAVSAAEPRPNILFIMADDHSAAAISAYGSKVNQTPHLDRLANEGMRFDRVFCVNSICSPSRATILTGKYSHLNGVPTFNAFDGSQPTVAKYLQARRLLHRHDWQMAPGHRPDGVR